MRALWDSGFGIEYGISVYESDPRKGVAFRATPIRNNEAETDRKNFSENFQRETEGRWCLVLSS
jgi:hypothetical protein